MKLLETKFVVFDTETTGLEPSSGDRIVEIAAVKIEDGKLIDKFQSLVNPGVPVSAAAFAVNGITAAMLKDAPSPAAVIPGFMEFSASHPLFAYNAKFDADFLRQELKLLGLTVDDDLLIIDILSMARVLAPGLASYALSSIIRNFGISDTQKHRALDDVHLSADILLKLFAILNAKGADDFSYVRNVFSVDNGSAKKEISRRIAEIEEAINLSVKIKIKYFSSFGLKLTEREVIPKEIIKKDNRDYLVGFCHLRNEERSFRIDSILHMEIA